MAFTRTNPQEASKKFFDGMGKGYADIMGIIIAAGVFVGGMQALGMVNAFIEAMKTSDSIVRIASIYGPFLLGVVSGSGDAAALAFNKAVTPHAETFGIAINKMGSAASLAGALGRTMSPLAGAAIICAGLAKVNPMEMAKRIAPGMLIATVVCMVMLLYI
jgi:DcuC family C4-dicarboxylate transporter